MAVSNNMVSYFNSNTKISILVPETWTGTTINEQMFRLFGEVEKVHEDFFEEYRVNISYELRKGEAGNKEWFKQLVEKNNEAMKNSYASYQLLSDTYFNIGIHDAYQKIYSWVEPETKFKLHQLQALITNNIDTLYIINASVIDGLQDKYLPIFQEIVKSTRIIPSKS